MSDDEDTADPVLTPAEELKAMAVIVKRAEGLSAESRAWLVARLSAKQTNGDGHHA